MSDFLTALRQMDGQPFDNFPRSCPPCGGVGDAEIDRVLATVFAQVCCKAFPTDDDKMELIWTKRAEWIAHAARWACEVGADEFGPARTVADKLNDWFCELHGDAGRVAA